MCNSCFTVHIDTHTGHMIFGSMLEVSAIEHRIMYDWLLLLLVQEKYDQKLI